MWTLQSDGVQIMLSLFQYVHLSFPIYKWRELLKNVFNIMKTYYIFIQFYYLLHFHTILILDIQLKKGKKERKERRKEETFMFLGKFVFLIKKYHLP